MDALLLASLPITVSAVKIGTIDKKKPPNLITFKYTMYVK